MSFNSISQFLHNTWQSIGQTNFGQAHAQKLEKIGSKFGFVRLTPETRKHIQSIVDTAMKSILNEGNVLKESSAPNIYTLNRKSVKEIRSTIQSAVTQATITSIREIAKENKISTASVSISQASQTDRFKQTLNKQLDKTFFQSNVKEIINQGSTHTVREFKKDYEKIKTEHPKIKELNNELLNLETSEKKISNEQKGKILQIKEELKDFEHSLRELSTKTSNLSSPERLEIGTKILNESKSLLTEAQEKRSNQLNILYEKIEGKSDSFIDLKKTGDLDRNSEEWKEFEKDIIAFSTSLQSTSFSDHFKKTEPDKVKGLNKIIENLNIELSK